MAAIEDNQKVVYPFLGKSGLRVSNIALGTLTFGEKGYLPKNSNEEESHAILNRYAEWGGNFIDTADIYSGGQSEEIIGTWLERQPREKFVIASKARLNLKPDKSANMNGEGLSRRHLVDSLEKSLGRLRTNYLDLYQCHWWDSATPLEETLSTLHDLVRIGKIRYVGFSNVTGWQMQKIVDTTQRMGAPPIISLQQQYSLMERQSEHEAFQVCKVEGIGVLPWSPLKGGLFSGKIKRGITPTEGRVGWATEDESRRTPAANSYSSVDEQAFRTIEALGDIAKKLGRSVPQVAIRWLLQKDVVTSVIIGARTLAQLDDNMAAANGWSLTEEEMNHLDDVSSKLLPYPYQTIYKINTRVNPHLPDPVVRSTW